MSENQNFQEIPKRFYSFETKLPFERCIECDCYLLNDKEYIIEKAIKRYKDYDAEDTIFDYAICQKCALKMRKEFSQESLTNVDNYFKKHISNIHPILKNEELNVDDCLKHCVIKNLNIDEIFEFQIYAYCKGNKLFKGIPPYMVSSTAIEEILPLLSNATTEFLNGFFDTHFSPDPSMLEPDPRTKLVFI